MKNNIFKFDNLPDIYDNFLQENVDIKINNIYLNYEYLIMDTVKIIELSLKNGVKKPLIMYNLFFAVEIFLKLYLIKFSSLQLMEIEKKGHNIFEMIELANKYDEKKEFEELKFLMIGFKDKQNCDLEIQKYYNYKYNHEKGNETLIFDFEIDENEKNKIREVIKWINSYMSIL